MPIVSNPDIMMGKPTIAGTRITVESILERLAAGETQEQILEASPRLAPDDIRAALGWAVAAPKGSPASRNLTSAQRRSNHGNR